MTTAEMTTIEWAQMWAIVTSCALGTFIASFFLTTTFLGFF